jgi:hypothetical protein
MGKVRTISICLILMSFATHFLVDVFANERNPLELVCLSSSCQTYEDVGTADLHFHAGVTLPTLTSTQLMPAISQPIVFKQRATQTHFPQPDSPPPK